MSAPRQNERDRMVKVQLEGRGIRSPKVLEAFRRVPRHEFVSSELQGRAYEDGPLPIGSGQTISQPYMVALMTEAAEVEPGNKVLEVGTGCGYQTAILAELRAEVFTVERVPKLAAAARERLRRLGWGKIRFRVGDGTLGWPEEAPFEAILVAAGAPRIPRPLTGQLAPAGRLVIPLEEGWSQTLYLVRRTADGLRRERQTLCTFVPLIGEFGWPDDR